MTNASNTPHDPYTPPPAPDASGTGVPAPAAPGGVPPVPQAPFAEPFGYAPPPAAAPYDAAAPQQPVQPYGYPGQSTVPAPNGRRAGSPQTSSIIALVAGAVSIFILPWFAGIIGIGMGVQALRLQSTQRRIGMPTSAGHTAMAIAGIVLGALGIVLKMALDFLLS